MKVVADERELLLVYKCFESSTVKWRWMVGMVEILKPTSQMYHQSLNLLEACGSRNLFQLRKVL